MYCPVIGPEVQYRLRTGPSSGKRYAWGSTSSASSVCSGSNVWVLAAKFHRPWRSEEGSSCWRQRCRHSWERSAGSRSCRPHSSSQKHSVVNEPTRPAVLARRANLTRILIAMAAAIRQCQSEWRDSSLTKAASLRGRTFGFARRS